MDVVPLEGLICGTYHDKDNVNSKAWLCLNQVQNTNGTKSGGKVHASDSY